MHTKNTIRTSPYEIIPIQTEDIAKTIIDAAYKVHTVLGPGLLESVYEACLAHELRLRKLTVENQVSLPVVYEGIKVDSGLRMDLMVENCVIIEIKAVENMIPLYKAQLLTYLKLTNIRIGLLINFNVIHLRDGIQRLVN